MNIPIKPFALGLVLLGLGFALGRLSGDPSDADRPGREALGVSEMDAAIRAALQTKGTLPHVSRLARVLENLDPTNMEGAARVFDEMITSVDQQDIRLFLGAWAALDPEAAFDGAMGWSLPSMRRLGAGIVMREWAENGNALEAMQHLNDLGEWKTRDPAFAELVNGWVSSGDIEGVTDFVSTLPDSDGRDVLLASMTKAILLEHGLDGIIRWADAVPVDAPGKFKKTAFRKALRQLSNRDPVRAAAWYEQQENEEYATVMMAVVAAEWVEQDPEAAIAWVLARPHEAQRGQAMERLMNRWVNIDRNAATTWMQQADLDSESSRMLEPFIRGLAATDPVEASEWVSRIRDPQRRERVIMIVAAAWQKLDRASAEAWIETLELSEEARVKIARVRPGLTTGQQLVIQEEKTP
jgi:hypothetical protein